MDYNEEEEKDELLSDYWVGYNEEESEESEEEQPSEIFKCTSCGFMYDLANPPKYLHPFNYYVIGGEPLKVKCPNCRKTVIYSTATKEEYDKYVEKKEKQKEEKEKKKQEKIRSQKIEQIKDDLSELIDDLKGRLFKNEITPQRFAVLLTNMSNRIIARYGKDLGIDTLEYRKTVYELSDGILKTYRCEQKSEELLEEYSQNIEEDELYKAELGYYIEDNKFAIPEYELRERIKEYDRQDEKIRSEEYKKEIEEKYQARKNELLQKAEERERRKKLREIL